ncbi:MAG: peptidoglycan editing factor PgeF [Chloroflexi bacterium]|nr:peptidoglycan editing factor PgeF [Chloroflexota bacterium]
MPMRLTEQSGLIFGTFPLLENSPAAHAVAGRAGGASAAPYASLNLGWSVGDNPASVAENRRRIYERLQLDPQRGAAGQQVHRDSVACIGENAAGVLDATVAIPNTDALLTNHPGVGLLVIAADCVPLLFVDPVRRVVGAAHAGWRGTVQNIAARVVETMAEAYGSRPGDLLVGIGPSIGQCCYEVDNPVLEPRRAALPSAYDPVAEPTRPGHARIDLWEANRLLLLAAGVPEAQIEVGGVCTSCRRDVFFSERAEGRPSGRFGAVIALPA